MATLAEQPITLRTDTSCPADAEIAQLIEEVGEGRLDGLREYLARTRASGEWQDRIHVLERVSPNVSIDALDTACAAEPDAADLLVIRCSYYAELAKSMRGTGTSDQVSGANYRNAADCVRAALNDMSRSTQLDDKDPTVYTMILRPLTIFSQTELQQRAFAKATEIAPDLVPAHFFLIASLSKRWGGSHEASLAFARQAMAKAAPGSDMAACLFWAHTLVRTHFLYFDEDKQSAKRYALRRDNTGELNAALDAWLVPSYAMRRSSVPYLRKASEWYLAAGDQDRLQQVLACIEGKPYVPSAARTSSSSKGGGGVLGWLFGGR